MSGPNRTQDHAEERTLPGSNLKMIAKGLQYYLSPPWRRTL
jgi:hypothetical protein